MINFFSHHDCLLRLTNILQKLRKDFFPEKNQQPNLPRIWEITRQETRKYGLRTEFAKYEQPVIESADDEPFAILAEIFQSNQLYVHAFILFIMAINRNITRFGVVQAGENHIKKAMALKKEVKDPNLEAVFEVFQPGFQSVLCERQQKMTIFQYLNCILDKLLAQYYAARNINDHVVLDLEILHLKKCIEYQNYQNLEELLMKLLQAACKAMNPKLKRYRQARHMISVVNELMKKCDEKQSVTFKRLSEILMVTKCSYWGMILAFTELRDVVIQLAEGIDDQIEEMFLFKDECIELGVELPEEDEQLPVILLETDEERLVS